MLCLKIAECVANSVVPDETPRSVRRLIWGYTVCPGLSVQILTINMVLPAGIFTTAGWLANSVDPDQMPIQQRMLWVYTVYLGPSAQKRRVYTAFIFGLNVVSDNNIHIDVWKMILLTLVKFSFVFLGVYPDAFITFYYVSSRYCIVCEKLNP